MSGDFLAGIQARRRTAVCGEGWWPLSDRLDKALVIDPHYNLVRVKQMYGMLRYTAHTYVREDTLRGACEQLSAGAEEMSAQTCEVCGHRGRLYRTQPPHVSLETLCVECAITESQPGRDYIPTTKEN